MAVRRSSLRVTHPRRKTSWSIGPRTNDNFGSPQAAISTTSSVLATTGAAILADGVTIVRMRGNFRAWLISVNAASTGFACAFGVGLARLPAFTAGMASLPKPFTDEDDELWLYHRYFNLTAGGAIGAAASSDNDIVNAIVSGIDIEVDSKAMRKVDVNDVIYAAIEVQLSGVASMNWAFSCRLLAKLP